MLRTGLYFSFCFLALIHLVMCTFLDHLSIADTVVHVDKGYVLQRVGIFSPTLHHDIVHTFISLDNVCVTSPSSDVCTFTRASLVTHVLELATLLAPRKTNAMMLEYDRERVGQLNADSLSRTLAHHRPEKFLNESRPILHLVADRLFLDNSGRTSYPSTSSSDSIGIE